MAATLGKILIQAELAEPATIETRLGSYRLERKLGAGGMGEVFAAVHVETGEAVALKTLSTTTATRLYRFKREFRALADVSHRNLVRLYELVVSETGPAFFTMELLEGRPFADWVRGATPVGELPGLERLEQGLRQLVEGVHHLHAQGCIHRDLKPSNVLVTGEGRVVVLDFGLVSELSERDGGITRDKQILGTPSYMAPEQALGNRAGPAADYYAVGVMLFECLTGRLPHDGTALQQLLAKHDTTVDPGLAAAAMPERWRALCTRLLARAPDARPSGRELLAQLCVPSVSQARPEDIFVGRTDELASLHAALADVSEQEATVVVHVRGQSGDGKSALARRFRSELESTGAIVLHGRCREQETVPFKGVDAVVDALSAYLRRLPEDERKKLRPPDLDALVRLFPVLDEIWERPEPLHLDVGEVRKLGGVILRNLLDRLTHGRALVVHIDDFQWADADSVSLLDALVRPPEGARILLLLSYRAEATTSEALVELSANETLGGPRVRRIELGPLLAKEARELASSLLRMADPDVRRAQAETIALRSRGRPFFIAQMALDGEQLAGADTDLDLVIVRRLSELHRDARRLLEVVAVFGGPVSIALACELCGTSEDAVDSLCAQGLLVREDAPSTDARIEAAHDRVREVVLGELDADDRNRLHRRIGEHLLSRHDEAPMGDDLFAVVNHLDAGMRDLRALSPERRLALAQLARAAGERALESGAWVAARRYLGRAYELAEPWLPESRAGRGEHELCVAIAFGRARAEIAVNEANGSAAVDDLLGWSLSMADYCRIARWYSCDLSLRRRWRECVEFGVRALARLGVRIPRRPSWPRALLSYLWGRRSIRRTGLERIRSLPPVEDDRARAVLDIIAYIGGPALAVDVKLHLALMGTYGRLLAKHGLHDGVSVAFSVLVLTNAVRDGSREGKDLRDMAQGLAEHRGISTFARFTSQCVLLLVSHLFQPLRAVVAHGERIYSRACEVAPQALVELIALTHWMNCYFAGGSLPKLAAFIDSVATDGDRTTVSFVSNALRASRGYIRALRGDAEPMLASSDFDWPTSQLRLQTSVTRVEMAILLGDHETAWRLTLALDRRYERRLGPSWFVAIYAMLGVVVMAERWPHAGRRERRRMRRMIFERRATARRWAKRCAENYQPMLDIVDGEIAALEGRYEDAVTAYERARSLTSEHESHRLAGLASERLAKLARRHGHTLVAQAAFDAAREAYEAWGAGAVVRRLEQERAATPTR